MEQNISYSGLSHSGPISGSFSPRPEAEITPEDAIKLGRDACLFIDPQTALGKRARSIILGADSSELDKEQISQLANLCIDNSEVVLMVQLGARGHLGLETATAQSLGSIEFRGNQYSHLRQDSSAFAEKAHRFASGSSVAARVVDRWFAALGHVVTDEHGPKCLQAALSFVETLRRKASPLGEIPEFVKSSVLALCLKSPKALDKLIELSKINERASASETCTEGSSEYSRSSDLAIDCLISLIPVLLLPDRGSNSLSSNRLQLLSQIGRGLAQDKLGALTNSSYLPDEARLIMAINLSALSLEVDNDTDQLAGTISEILADTSIAELAQEVSPYTNNPLLKRLSFGLAPAPVVVAQRAPAVGITPSADERVVIASSAPKVDFNSPTHIVRTALNYYGSLQRTGAIGRGFKGNPTDARICLIHKMVEAVKSEGVEGEAYVELAKIGSVGIGENYKDLGARKRTVTELLLYFGRARGMGAEKSNKEIVARLFKTLQVDGRCELRRQLTDLRKEANTDNFKVLIDRVLELIPITDEIV